MVRSRSMGFWPVIFLFRSYFRKNMSILRKKMKTGYCIKTMKYKLRCPHPEWLERTEEHYRKVLIFYYHLLLDHEELWEQNLLQIQGNLEHLTIAGRDGRQPEHPIPFDKVPVYFRRSAINKASGNLKSLLTKYKHTGKTPDFTIPESINASVTYFKGMYKNMQEDRINLKVWDGEKWHWMDSRLKGQEVPEGSLLLSPSVVFKNKEYWLHVPVKLQTSDARNAKERMRDKENICSVQFTNTDIFAMCCILDADGRQKAVYSCRGGDAYSAECKAIKEKIAKSRIYTDNDDTPQPNRRYYMHLKNLSEHYAHQVSRETVDLCIQEQAKVIVLPAYDEAFTKMVRYRSGIYSPLQLECRIRKFLKYKAWCEGIVVLELSAEGTSSRCFNCGGKVKKKGKMFICENGHQGSRFLNSARNLGLKCLQDFADKRKSDKA